MSGLRFAVGEMALVALNLGEAPVYPGDVVEILERGPVYSRTFNRSFDYVTTDPRPGPEDTGELYVMDIELRKINPPEEPESMTRREEVEA